MHPATGINMDTGITAYLLAGAGDPAAAPLEYVPPYWLIVAVTCGWSVTALLTVFFIQ
jgi:hypothetical protein